MGGRRQAGGRREGAQRWEEAKISGIGKTNVTALTPGAEAGDGRERRGALAVAEQAPVLVVCQSPCVCQSECEGGCERSVTERKHAPVLLDALSSPCRLFRPRSVSDSARISLSPRSPRLSLLLLSLLLTPSASRPAVPLPPSSSFPTLAPPTNTPLFLAPSDALHPLIFLLSLHIPHRTELSSSRIRSPPSSSPTD